MIETLFPEEWETAHSMAWTACDTNGDGWVGEHELCAVLCAMWDYKRLWEM